MEQNNSSNDAKLSISSDIAKLSGDKIKAIGRELESMSGDPETRLDDYEIDLSADYPEPKFTLKLSGISTLPRGDIQAIKAKSKNGKSFLCSVLIASIFGCKDFGFETLVNEPVVLYLDTEQNKCNTAKLAARVHTMLGWDAKNNRKGFHAYSLRTMDMPERLPFIKKIVSEKKPTHAFIDGVADLIDNFNDVEQSTHIINDLMKLSAENDCCVCCVLHTNKAKDDSGMKGHLGTMLLQKASDVFEVKKNGDTFSVTESDCRNQPVDDFAFLIDGLGIPKPTATQKDIKEKQRDEELKENMRKAFADAGELSFTELLKSYALNAVVSESTAKRAMKESKGKGLIQVTKNGKYSLS